MSVSGTQDKTNLPHDDDNKAYGDKLCQSSESEISLSFSTKRKKTEDHDGGMENIKKSKLDSSSSQDDGFPATCNVPFYYHIRKCKKSILPK